MPEPKNLVRVNFIGEPVAVTERSPAAGGGKLYVSDGALIDSVDLIETFGTHLQLAFVDFMVDSEQDTVFLRGSVHYSITGDIDSDHAFTFTAGPVFVDTSHDHSINTFRETETEPGIRFHALPQTIIRGDGLASDGSPLTWTLQPGIVYRAYLTLDIPGVT